MNKFVGSVQQAWGYVQHLDTSLNDIRIVTKKSADEMDDFAVKANKAAQKRLKKSQSFMKDSKYKEFFEEINIALNGYISDKLAITTSQLTKENVYSQLLSHGVKENTCQNVLEILNECEMALYTPQIDNKTVDAIYQKTISAINDIEAVKIKHSKK